MSAPLSTGTILDGTISDSALANRALTEDEIVSWAFTPPSASTRDAGWYRAAHQVRLAVKAAESASWHIPISLATGSYNPRVDTPRYGSRFAMRLSSISTGRPWAANALAMYYQREGAITKAADGGYFAFPEFTGGMSPNLPKPAVPHQVAYTLTNMSLHQGLLKSRRGYKVMASAGSSVSGTPCAFYDATDSSGQTYHLYFAGGTIYSYDNGNLTSVDTGWPVNELPTCATIGQKTFFLSSTRKRVFISGTFSDVGVTAPTDAPLFISSTPADGAPVATTPGYEYVYTFHDGTKVTDSGPSPILRVVLPIGSPASTITIGIGIAASSAVTERTIWRRKVGDANNVFTFVGVVSDNTTLTFTDDSELPGIETLDYFAGEAVTADFPSTTACAAWNGKLIAWGGSDDRILYVSELGDGERWWGGSQITCEGAIRGVVGGNEGRLLVFTDKTVESIEGDFIRSLTGEIGITRHVIDSSKGSFGPFAQTVAGGRVFWADANGVHTLQSGVVYRDVSSSVSWPVTPIVQAAVDTLGTSVVLDYDYISSQLWVLMTQADAANVTRNRVVMVLDLEKKRWTLFDHALSHISRVRDGTYGYQFIGCDYYGQVLELDVYDGDGCQGNESWMPASPAFSSCSVANKTVTFSGGTFPTTGSGLRGVSCIVEDVSAGTSARQTILSNTADTLTLDDIPASTIVTDKAYVGGIASFFETGEVDMGTLDKKILREVGVGLIDAANGAY